MQTDLSKDFKYSRTCEAYGHDVHIRELFLHGTPDIITKYLQYTFITTSKVAKGGKKIYML